MVEVLTKKLTTVHNITLQLNITSQPQHKVLSSGKFQLLRFNGKITVTELDLIWSRCNTHQPGVFVYKASENNNEQGG